MRIALITAHSPIATGGLYGHQPQPLPLARALAGQGHRVTLYTRSESPACACSTIVSGGVAVEHITAGPARPLPDEQAGQYLPEFAARLADRWQARPPDVVHAISWTSGLAARAAVRGLGVPVVLTFGSLASAERRLAGGRQVPAGRIRVEAALGRGAAAVLAGSDDEADELAKLAVPKHAIQVIPAGVDTSQYAPEGEMAERSGRPRLVAFAREGRGSDMPAVIQALAQLPGAELVIVGGPDTRHLPRSGPFRELAQLASALGVRSRVSFAGALGPRRLAALLRSAQVLVSAAPYEPSGVAAIHAMACGTPAVVSAVGAHRDAVIDGTTGLLVPPQQPVMLARALRGLLATPALLQAYGIAAADRARSRYSWERIATETAGAYARCLPVCSPAAASARAARHTLDEELAEVERAELARRVVAFA